MRSMAKAIKRPELKFTREQKRRISPDLPHNSGVGFAVALRLRVEDGDVLSAVHCQHQT